MSVGSNIKKRRLELRMSQQELANAMGYKTRSTVAKIESGENDVSQTKLRKFAAVLDTSVEALISDYVRPQREADPVFSDSSHRTVAVILAGGNTSAQPQNIPNQFVAVNGKPILVYSMDAYQSHPAVEDIYVVCLKGWENIVKAYARQYGITKLRGLVPAGSSGTASLKNAVEYISRFYEPEDMIIVQEATRPLVTVETISTLLMGAAEKGSGTVCHSMEDYVQFNITGPKAEHVDRTATIAVQSPEAHKLELLNRVFRTAEIKNHRLTESCCTMLLYHLGFPIHFIRSNVNNIKIAQKEDMAALSALTT